MKINRIWAMPSKNTFSINPINKIVARYLHEKRTEKMFVGSIIIDPFANTSVFNKEIDYSNDLDPTTDTTHHMDALDFLRTFKSDSIDMVLFDPPYSPRQVSECYKKLDKTVNMQTTQSSFWGNIKKEITRITKESSIVITCGWNSGGIGKTNGFEIVEILIVPHGGWHNDTIVTVEVKLP